MNDYKNILKLLLKDAFKKEGKSKRTGIIVLCSLMLFFDSLAIVLLFLMKDLIIATQMQNALITTFVAGDIMLTVFFGISPTISKIFMSKDNEFFLSLPIKPMSVFFAKLSFVYLSELLTSALFLFPVLIAAGIALQLPWLFFVMIIPLILFTPVFAMLVISIFAIPFTFISSLFKNRGTAMSILTIGIYVIIMALYFMFVMGMRNIDYEQMQQSYNSFSPIMPIISNIIYPLYMLINFATLTPVFSLSLALSLVIEFSIFILCFAAALLFVYLIYKYAATFISRRLAEFSSESQSKGKQFLASSSKSALIKKEIKELLRNPTVAMSVVSGIFLCPMIVVIYSLLFSTNAFSGGIDLPQEVGQAIKFFTIWLSTLIGILAIGVGLNSGSITAFSREGENFGFLRTLPISGRDVFAAKEAVYLGITMIETFLSVVVGCIMSAKSSVFDWWPPLLLLVIGCSWGFAMTDFSLALDLKNPKLKWLNVGELLKRSKNNVVSLVWVLVTITLIMVFMMLSQSRAIPSQKTIILIVFGGIALLGIVAATIVKLQTNKKIDILFDRVE
jgi:ABC-2 type transport system permease protein